MLEFLERFGSWYPLIVLVAAYSETAAFLGVLIPGETLMIAGGAAAGITGAPIPLVVGAAITGAILGDLTGYLVGRRYGLALLDRPLLHRFRNPVEKAGDFLNRHGMWALVLGRFLSMLRAVVPFAAGSSGMPYRRFAIGNVFGSVIYGGVITGFGYWAGSRWEEVERLVRRGGLALAIIVGLAVAITLGARWIARNRSKVENTIARLVQTPVVGLAVRVAATPTGRLRPYLGLLPQFLLAAIALAGLTVAGVVDWSFVEARAIRWIQDIDPKMVEATGVVAGSTQWIAAAVGAIGVSAIAGRRSARSLALIVAALATAVALATLLNDLIDRPFGPVDLDIALGSNFPDMPTAAIAALSLAVAWPWSRSWAAGTRQMAIGFALAVVVAVARIMAIASYPVDALAGLALGIGTAITAGIFIDSRLRARLSLAPTIEPREGTPDDVAAPPRPSGV